MTGWALDTLIATSALMLLVLIVREPVRRQFGAAAAYALWLVPAARMVMPPITQTVERVIPAAEPVYSGPLMLASFAPVAAPDPTFVERLGGWPTLLLATWATGAILFLAVGLLRYRRQRRLVLDEAVQLAKLGNIRLVRSETVRGPIAFGILDRVIAVPHDFDQRFDAAQRRLALDHELSHHRSGDIAVNHFAFTLLGLQWFNPIAWFAHAAFRFDQEAACDARILDTAGPSDRAAYGHTIAKAASGRTLLFASALDHHHNLHRRLKSMLTNPTPARRTTGKLAVVGALAIALPLTATWATRYVDVDAPNAPLARLTPAAIDQTPTRADMETAKADLEVLRLDQETSRRDSETALRDSETARRDSEAARRVTPGDADVNFGNGISFLGEDIVRINGKAKRWSDLSSSERAEIRRETVKAKQELDKQMSEFPRLIANARREIESGREERHRGIAEARIDIAKAMAEIDANASAIRGAGQDPEQIREQVRASLRQVEQMDIDKMVRDAMKAIDPERMDASLRTAQASLAKIEAQLDQLDRK